MINSGSSEFFLMCNGKHKEIHRSVFATPVGPFRLQLRYNLSFLFLQIANLAVMYLDSPVINFTDSRHVFEEGFGGQARIPNLIRKIDAVDR